VDHFQPARCGRRRAACRKIPLGVGCWLAVRIVFYPGATARAQEALHSALALDAVVLAQTPTVALPPEQPHLGPVSFTLGAYFGVEANDNINASQNGPQADTIIHSGLNVGLFWPATDQSDLNFSLTMGYAKYLRHPSNDRIEIAPGSALTWKISFDDGSLTFYDQFSDSQSVTTEASVSGVSNLPRIDNTIGARAGWQPGRWLFELGYSHDNFFSDAPADRYLNRASEFFIFRGAHRLAEDTQLGLEASTSLTGYEIPIQSNNTSYSLGPYFEWQITHFINASARGGYTVYAFAANGPGQPAQNLSSYYGSLKLTQQLTEFVSHSLSVERDISLGLNQGNNYTEQLTASYAADWAATANLGLHLNLTYENGTQPLTELFLGVIPVTVTEKYNRIGISPGISYQFTKKLSGSLTGSHWERTSNISGKGYQDNTVAALLNFTF